MPRPDLRSAIFFAVACLVSSPDYGQAPPNLAKAEPTVELVKLSPPVYPQVARLAHISGDVTLKMNVGKDGATSSPIVASGPRLLWRAAVDSLRDSTFECRNCTDEVTPYELTYSFKLIGDCSGPGPAPEAVPGVVQSGNRVSVADYVACISDPGAQIGKRRSWKCLYLWNCSAR